MAFCTQRKFPGQTYDNNGLAEINKMKDYIAIKDHRAWSIDQNQQTSYLVDAVHKGEGDTIISEHTISNGVAQHKNETKKTSKRVGTVATDSSIVSRSDSIKIFELSMELEETKLHNRTLKNEVHDLKKHIAHATRSDREIELDENMQNLMKIMEEIISERNDLKELLDKFLGITDQIIELKTQSEQMKNIENEYMLLQSKFRDQEIELEILRNEKKTFEERILELRTTNSETISLKETNSKLEKDLHELSNVISVSDNFIHDQENEIQSKLHMIADLNNQIENLKIALTEAEAKLNKKLRLEMDVELMEKELSIMIENSAESSSYNQQVMDRQVEDLATAIKLTLGCMNYEFENNEEENLFEANRQLKTLLLESSNKILEFKDVINKQEQNLMKVSNDFACKNDELTECLATVEELKRQLAQHETNNKFKQSTNNVPPCIEKLTMCCTDNAPAVGVDQEEEMFVNEVDLADSPQISECEDDGREIDDLENIFETSCAQQEYKNSVTSELQTTKPYTRVSEDRKLVNEARKESKHSVKQRFSSTKKVSQGSLKIKPGSCSVDVLSRLSNKIERMSSYIQDLESKNKDLIQQVKQKSTSGSRNEVTGDPENSSSPNINKASAFQSRNVQEELQKSCQRSNASIRILQQPVPSTKSLSEPAQEILPVAHHENLSSNRMVQSISREHNRQTVSNDGEKELKNLQHKVNEMTSQIDDLQKVNAELNETIRLLQQPVGSPSQSTTPTVLQFENLSTNRCVSLTNEEKHPQGSVESKNAKLAGVDHQLKDSESYNASESKGDGNGGMTTPSDKNEIENLEQAAEKDQPKCGLALPEESQCQRKDLHDMDITELIKKNAELTDANEELLLKINYLKQNPQNQIHRGRLSTKSQQFESDFVPTDVEKIETENINLKLENEKLVVEIGKLKNLENSSHKNVLDIKKELEQLTSINEQLSAELCAKKIENESLRAKELDAMPVDLRDLVLKNEELKTDNEKLLLKIRSLEQTIDRTNEKLKTADDSDQNRDNENNTEPDWLPSNEDLVAEIEKLQQSKNKSNLSIRQMEKDLKKMEAMNENLLAQLNDKEAELKQFSIQPDIEYIRRQNEELTMVNEKLADEISVLKNSEACARSNEVIMKEEMEKLVTVNKALMAEIIELKRMRSEGVTKTDEQLRAFSDSILSERSPELSSHSNILQIGKDLERLAAINESLLALNDSDPEKKSSIMDATVPDINQLLKKNRELRNANENLSSKVKDLQIVENRTQMEATESKNRLASLSNDNESLRAQIKQLERSTSKDKRSVNDLHTLQNENENLRTTNEKLVGQIAHLEEKLKNIENRTATYLKTSYLSSNERQSTTTNDTSNTSNATDSTSTSTHTDNDYNMEIDWMVADMKKLQNKNENLKATNDKLLSQISELQSCANRSNMKDSKDSDAQLIYASNRNIEIEWMKTDMDVLQKKNEKLKIANESLAAEIGNLKNAESRTHKNIQQMERDLLRLSAMNERLSTQLNDKRMDKKTVLKVRSQEVEAKDLLKKIDELTNSNECLSAEIQELKGVDIDKMRSDLKKFSSQNEHLKLQINELRMLSGNDLKMESDWTVADMRRLTNKNKKLNISNQNLLNEINELRKEFKSLENRANMNALQKIKEMEKLTASNENLKEQLNVLKNEKKATKSFELGADASIADVRKVHKKNEELKAANEKLLSVIINLKNSEKSASSKVADLEKELNRLRETNKSLQDTLENCVEKDWSKPKTELERICQLILNDGILSLTDTELHYMHKWFCKSSSSDVENPKTSRKSTRKHCRICHQAVDPFDKTCDCKQYEEKKRLNLLKEIEETKLAIQHIQSSNDVEFDLNDVRNRLLKGKPSDESDDDEPFDVRMSRSQGSVNVRAHIVTKHGKRDYHANR